MRSGPRRVAFAVDRVLAEQEVLVKGLGPRVRRLRHASGATVLSSGDPALVLSPPMLVRAALEGRSPGALRGREGPAPRPRVLVVEDSVTVRSLERSILDAAGYAVTVATDGEEAWRLLSGEAEFDVVVSDVEMPLLDGCALAARIRASPRLKDLPVVLLTSLENDADRARGVEAGADAYLVKSAFDQASLLETIGQLV